MPREEATEESLRPRAARAQSVLIIVLLAILLALSPVFPVRAAAPPLKSMSEVKAYIERNHDAVRDKLERYNKDYIKLKTNDNQWFIGAYFWEIHSLEGDRVFVNINYQVGRTFWQRQQGEALFELRWNGDELEFVSHGPVPKQAQKRGGGWLGDSDTQCTPNYYAPKPCTDTARLWSEFAAFNGLPLNPESAAIYQAYRQNDSTTGDRLLARARGQPDPSGRSAFNVQSEVAAMGLGQLQQSTENPCDLNPYAPRPCTGLLQRFQLFARQHGLPLNRHSATMFEAYAYGNYVKADVLYAMAKGLEVPSYGYVSTSVGRDQALIGLREPIGATEAGACEQNPYSTRPCPESIDAWRNFASRYQLDDTAANARIFQAYVEGDHQIGDRLLAQAKGVSLDTLLEASGVPAKGLVIEVYPGRQQKMYRVVIGS